MITETQTKVEQHYSIPNLPNIVLETLKKVKNNPEKYTKEDFKTFDEFHLQGRQATIELAEKIPLHSQLNILDLGSGIGGPARTLASEFNCSVTGIELVKEYYNTAIILSELVQMDQITKFYNGSALDLPFKDESFDIVWMQHMTMNIEEKQQLFSEAHRVLKPKGKLALYEICAGSEYEKDFQFPVPWANSSAINFLLKIDEFISKITNQGFKQLSLENVTKNCVNWIENVLKANNGDKVNPLGLNLISGSDFGVKVKNILKNAQSHNIEVIQAIFEK